MTGTGGTGGDGPLRGWRSQLIFFLSGSIFVFNQQESYWGANDPRSMLNGVSQYAGMSVFALVWAALTRRRSPLLALRASKLRAALTVAIPDACDTFFMVYGIAHAGSGVFIIVFAFVTVWTAMFRKCILRRNITWRQWVALLLIAGGQCVVVMGTNAGGGEGSFLLGAGATLVAALCDAIMYVFTERVLTGADPPPPVSLNGAPAPADGGDDESSPSVQAGGGEEALAEPAAKGAAAGGLDEVELTFLVGALNLPVMLAYVAAYTALGKWGPWVEEPIAEGAASWPAVVAVWAVDALFYFAHFLAFFYCCSNSNAVIAAVNKSLQAALVFFLSSAFFCGHDAAQCLNGMKIASALIVCVAILLYSSASFPACEWPAWCACSKYRSLPEE